MYRDQLEQNLEQYRQNEKCNSPKLAVVFFAISILLGLNAYGLIVKGVGIGIMFVDWEVAAILSILLCLLCIPLSVVLLIRALRNQSNHCTDKYLQKYLDSIHKIGSEEDVFSRIDRLKPYNLFPDGELRFDSTLIAGTSNNKLSNNFVYPIHNLYSAGLSINGRCVQLHLQFNSDGYYYTHSFTTSPQIGGHIISELKNLQPHMIVQPLKN